MSIRASIDLGTNTCLLLVADVDKDDRVISVISDHANIVRLGEGVDRTREIQPQAMDRTLKVLNDYAKVVANHGVSAGDVIAVATSQARDAKNGAEFFRRVEAETGFRFRVISGDQEAQCTFAGGLLSDTEASESVVIDIGGGSTELMSMQGGQSVDLGSVRFTERFFKSEPVSDDAFWKCQELIDAELEVFKEWRRKLSEKVQLVAVAGTATTIAQWQLGLKKFNQVQIDQCIITRGDVHRLVEDLKWRTTEERIHDLNIEKGRADVLLAGALILWRVMEVLNFKTARISTRGLRFGVFGLN